MAKVLITGGSGILGKRLIDIFKSTHDVYAPTSTECDITSEQNCKEVIERIKPDILIHAAAFVDTHGCEKDISKALNLNVEGTINVVKAISSLPNSKLVYISSEYVFGGGKGNYTTDDRLDPINVYGKTKAAAEYIVSLCKNYQILRCPFIKRIHENVFVDQYCSRYFLDDLMEKIKTNILGNSEKIVHISNQRDTLFNIYKSKGYNPNPIKMDVNSLKIIPKDSSLKNNSI
jgi:nucleoside-diphosphate-sugar epimerase